MATNIIINDYFLDMLSENVMFIKLLNMYVTTSSDISCGILCILYEICRISMSENLCTSLEMHLGITGDNDPS